MSDTELILNSITELRNDMNDKFRAVDEKFDSIDRRFDIMEQENKKKFDRIDKKFEDMNLRFDINEAEHNTIGNILAKIEYEHGNKLAIILDAITTNNENHEIFKAELKEHDAEIFEHELRIKILEEKIS